jgi:hypothetical protein
MIPYNHLTDEPPTIQPVRVSLKTTNTVEFEDGLVYGTLMGFQRDDNGLVTAWDVYHLPLVNADVRHIPADTVVGYSLFPTKLPGV